MPIAITPGKWDWQLEEDRAKDGSIDPRNTILELRTLTVEQEAEIEDMSAELIMGDDGVEGGKLKRGSATLRILEYGLTGARNFKDEHGAPVDCTPGAFSSEHRRQIANAITERQKVTPVESDLSKPSSDTPGATNSPTAATADKTKG